MSGTRRLAAVIVLAIFLFAGYPDRASGLLAVTDGRTIVTLPPCQDHKPAYDGDMGPNTGGMGAFAPSPLVSADLDRHVMTRIVQPLLDRHRAEGDPFIGFLYVSLMLTPDGPKVIEFNVRFGDPEAQAVVPLLEGPFAKLLLASATGRLRWAYCIKACQMPAAMRTSRGEFSATEGSGAPSQMTTRRWGV